ncbi:MAG: SUMF1/EgtB/PvdO family nonheme iron enzyme [Verrucomicrobia bacterium]|nr:SUMF1/EgtB/PvdO family nonheme iron enzyme [Verrucomicrobiota bacterium]
MPELTRRLHLRLFLASPGDVIDERTVAKQVIEHAQYDSRWRGLITTEVIAWDTPGAVPMVATATPQASVAHGLPRPSECDIAIVIFWTRVGTPLPPGYTKPDGTTYASGTEWEYLDAFDAAKRTGRPTVLVYRRIEDPVLHASDPDREEKLRHWEWVNSFFQRFGGSGGPLAGGYNQYRTPDEFRRQFEGHLKSLIYGFASSKSFVPADALAPAPHVPMWHGSPFPGLRAFTPDDEPIFFGRGAEVDDLVGRLHEDRGFVAVIGSSGSGKSSLVAAGLIPRLRRNALEGSRSWRFCQMTPGGAEGDPFRALAVGLIEIAGGEFTRDRLTALLAQPGSGGQAIDTIAEQSKAEELLLFVDQFEELFTSVSESSRRPFVQLLTQTGASKRVRVVITMRADFYHRCIEVPEMARLLTAGSFPLGAAGLESLLEMVRNPADRAGITFEEELPGLILKDVGFHAGALPLMAFALYQLYEKREVSGRLTHQAYQSFGGIRGAIVKTAEEVLDKVATSIAADSGAGLEESRAEVNRALTDIFRDLVDVGEGMNAVRRRARLSRIAPTGVSVKLVRSLVDARLLVTGRGIDGDASDPFIEVAHEALLTNWPRVSVWLESVRDDLRLRSQLQRAAVEWNEQKRPEGYRWSDERSVDAYKRLQRLPYEPSKLEYDFLGPLNVPSMLAELDVASTSPEQRALIGVRLALLGDPRPGTGVRPHGLPDIEWCDVPEGTVLIGQTREEHRVARFRIARYPVTWAQYELFVRASDGYVNAGWWEGLRLREQQPGKQIQRYANHPAENVSWVDATAYCRWLTSRVGYEVRLPTQWEWQLVATGGDPGRAFPWGEWEIGRANTREHDLNRTTAVGVFPQGAAPCGARDICGNVWEWCSDGEDLYPPDGNCPYGYRAVRGGSWNFGHETAKGDVSNAECAAYRFNSVGFRVAAAAD